MFVTKRKRGSNVIQFVMNNSMWISDFESFCEDLKEDKSLEEIKLIGYMVNMSNKKKLREAVEVINDKLRLIDRLSKVVIVTDRKNIQPISAATKRRLPILPLKIYEMEEETKALNWLNENDFEEMKLSQY